MEDGDDGVDRFLGNHGDLVSHLHVHDARGRGDTHLPAGAGEIDYDLLGEHLGGFDGTVAIEVFTDDVVLLRDTARRALGSLGHDRASDFGASRDAIGHVDGSAVSRRIPRPTVGRFQDYAVRPHDARSSVRT